MTEGGFIINSKILEEAMNFITKQQYMKAKRLEARRETTSMIVVKALATTLFASILLSSSKDKTIDKDIFKELIRRMKELKLEINVLKKYTRSST